MPGSASYSQRMAMVGSRLDGGAEGRLHAAHALFDLEALPAEEVAQPRAGLDLLIGQLRIVVDLDGEGFELVRQAIHGL